MKSRWMEGKERKSRDEVIRDERRNHGCRWRMSLKIAWFYKFLSFLSNILLSKYEY